MLMSWGKGSSHGHMYTMCLSCSSLNPLSKEKLHNRRAICTHFQTKRQYFFFLTLTRVSCSQQHLVCEESLACMPFQTGV